MTPPLRRSTRPWKAVVRSGKVAIDVVSPGPVLPKPAPPRLALAPHSVTPPPARPQTSTVACISSLASVVTALSPQQAQDFPWSIRHQRWAFRLCPAVCCFLLVPTYLLLP